MRYVILGSVESGHVSIAHVVQYTAQLLRNNNTSRLLRNIRVNPTQEGDEDTIYDVIQDGVTGSNLNERDKNGRVSDGHV